MATILKEFAAEAKIWAGNWHARQVVFDPGIQPVDQRFIILYFVQGRSLCFRDRELERKTVQPIKIKWDRNDAVAQYLKWRALNARVVAEKKYQSVIKIEEPSPPRKKCSECDGIGHWSYTVGSFSEGSNSDGQNHIAKCGHCNGQGFFDDVFVLL